MNPKRAMVHTAIAHAPARTNHPFIARCGSIDRSLRRHWERACKTVLGRKLMTTPKCMVHPNVASLMRDSPIHDLTLHEAFTRQLDTGIRIMFVRRSFVYLPTSGVANTVFGGIGKVIHCSQKEKSQ
jgi:hypothetical protein